VGLHLQNAPISELRIHLWKFVDIRESYLQIDVANQAENLRILDKMIGLNSHQKFLR
jgi:hypothetical protein